jgi:hypothetical protein
LCSFETNDFEERLKKANLTCGVAYKPENIPPGQVRSEGSAFLHPTFEEDQFSYRGVFLNLKNNPSQHAAILCFNLNPPFARLIVLFISITSITLVPPAFYGKGNAVRCDPSIPARVLQLPSQKDPVLKTTRAKDPCEEVNSIPFAGEE